MAPHPTAVLQPGSVSLHLSLAGAWARSTLRRLDVATSATAALQPATFDVFGDAMTAILTFYLALSHAREAAVGAPWLDTVLMDPGELADLHLRATHLRDTLMHFGEKAGREVPELARIRGSPVPANRREHAPRGAVSLSFGFEHGGAVLYGPTRKTTRREWTRLAWDEIGESAQRIEAWVADLLSRWPAVQGRWAPYVETHPKT